MAFEPFIDFPINLGESSEKFRLCNLQNIDDNTLAFFCDSVKENVFLLAGIRMLSVTEARRLGRKSTTLYPTISDYSLTEGDPGAPTLSRCIGCLTAKFNFEALRIFLIDPDSPVMEVRKGTARSEATSINMNILNSRGVERRDNGSVIITTRRLFENAAHIENPRSIRRFAPRINMNILN